MRLPIGWYSVVGAVLVAALGACSPALNWRTLPLGSLRFTLPCKPDQAQRDVVLAGVNRTLEMRGCEADGALFATSRIVVGPTEDTDALVQAWRAAALAALQAPPGKVEEVAPPNYRNLPRARAAAWLHAQGRDPRGSEVEAQLGWLVSGREVFHLAVYAPRLVPATIAPMMTGIDQPK
jgi:hypothetical protein